MIHDGANELQMNSIPDFKQSLIAEKSTVIILLIVLQNDNPISKASEVNTRFINMCGERNISFIDHTVTIDIERPLNKIKINLSKSRTTEFAKNVCEFLLK